jgi:hypothetical protein
VKESANRIMNRFEHLYKEYGMLVGMVRKDECDATKVVK